MLVSQKCQYALRAVFELSRRYKQGPVKIAEIARIQSIPERFLEAILAQLKQGGFADSKRGSEGGYFLIKEPADITVGDIIRFIQGPIGPVECVAGDDPNCPLYGDCVFLPMWQEAQEALAGVYDGTTFATLLARDKESANSYANCYYI